MCKRRQNQTDYNFLPTIFFAFKEKMKKILIIWHMHLHMSIIFCNFACDRLLIVHNRDYDKKDTYARCSNI